MRFADRAIQVIDPPITSFRQRHHALLESPDLIDLSQAVPSYRPPPPVSDAVAAAARDPGAHLYTSDPGLPECREAIAAWLRQAHGARLSADEVFITPGANAAFHFTANALLDPGDRAALLTPYYFNHAMSLRLLGAEVEEIRWKEPPPLDRIARSGARALVLVTPSNPTGRRIANLSAILEWARSTGIPLVVDEAYLEFQPDVSPASMLCLDGWAECAVVLGSFSKSLAMTGHRVGYVCAGREFLRQLIKVQDAAVICAPRIGQLAATAALLWSGLPEWLAERRREIDSRVAAFTQALSSIRGPFEVEQAGAFFAWVRHAAPDVRLLRARLAKLGLAEDEMPPELLVAHALALESRLLCLSGAMAGSEGRDHIRVAVGNADPARLREAAQRMQQLTLREEHPG
jgi:aspartate/methionine/tyrosine aminotransferase